MLTPHPDRLIPPGPVLDIACDRGYVTADIDPARRRAADLPDTLGDPPSRVRSDRASNPNSEAGAIRGVDAAMGAGEAVRSSSRGSPPGWRAHLGSARRFGLAAILGMWLCVVVVSVVGGAGSVDLLQLQAVARRLAAGAPLYLDLSGARFIPGSVDLFYGPPALAVASLPLTWFDAETVRRFTVALGLAMVLGSVVAIVGGPLRRPGWHRNAFGFDRWPNAAAAVAGALLSYAVLRAVTLGATSTLLLLLLAITWLGLARRSDTLVSLALGSAIAFRIYPAALILPLVLAGRWRGAGGALACAVSWWLLGAFAAGPNATSQYLGLLVALSGVVVGAGNAAPGGALVALGVAEPLLAVEHVVVLATGAALLVLGGFALGHPDPGAAVARVPPWRSPAGWAWSRFAAIGSSGRDVRLLGWGLAIAGMLLASPIVWDHYLTALLILTAGMAAVSSRAAWHLAAILFVPGSAAAVALVGLPMVGSLMLLSRLRRVQNPPG